MAQELVWDERKNAANRARHGFDFRDAEVVFESFAVIMQDDREDYGETRMVRLGFFGTTPVVVVYTEPDDHTCRIISFRRATRFEARALDEALLQRP